MEFDYHRLARCSDLIYFDGPLLSHFMDEYGDNYLMYWLEADGKYNRWMIIRTSITQIQNYIEKKITLREVILHPCDSFVWITDIDDALDCHNTQCVPLNMIPEAYLPEKDSLYEFQVENQTELSSIYNPRSLYYIMMRQIAGKEVLHKSHSPLADTRQSSSRVAL